MSEQRLSVIKGQTVVTLDNHELGTVSQVHGDYFTVSRGLFRSDLYVTLEDVNNIRGDRVYVNATEAEVDLTNWEEPPRDPDAGDI